MSDEILIERRGRVAWVTINRPQRRNTLDSAAVNGLRAVLTDLSDAPDVGAIVLTGAGDKAFCAGGDVASMQPADGALAMHHSRGEFAGLLVAMQRCHKPIVGRINGHALGGGFGLALNCDLAIAAETAMFGTPEIRLGLFPMMIMAVIVRNIGRKNAMELMLTGERISASRALEMGCVNRVVPADDLDSAVEELATKVAGFSPAILRLGRTAFYRTQDMAFEDALAHLHSELTINTLSEDTAEGVMAFFSKREPEWKGR